MDVQQLGSRLIPPQTKGLEQATGKATKAGWDTGNTAPTESRRMDKHAVTGVIGLFQHKRVALSLTLCCRAHG